MTRLTDIVTSVRAKNAGPFWLTIDIFCGTETAFERVCRGLDTACVAAALGVAPATLKRFEIADLAVLKLSLPRPQIQGTLHDRDMHGASFATLIAELEV